MSVSIKLREIAHGRSGDKGNRLNVNVIAFHPLFWPVLLEVVTEAKVAQLYRHRGVSKVVRYELPRLSALNFVLEDVLEGGVNSSLAIDTHGKTLSYILLGLDVDAAKLPFDWRALRDASVNDPPFTGYLKTANSIDY